jgi:glycosyltransferase involved in cell wall biosynthesis
MEKVSIILPTYNRASFLPAAFSSLIKQDYKNWELIIVDDGSIDETETLIAECIKKYSFSIHYIKQKNSGPGVARNNGIKKANGTIIAFFDSDDTWDREHLSSAVSQLNINRDVDWVYFSCRRVNLKDKSLISSSTFYNNLKQNVLFNCVEETRDELNILNNKLAVLAQINEGIDSGLQNSVIRKKVFETHLIPDFRIGEDRLFILLALKSKFKIAFVDKTTVTYFVHDNNTSDTDINGSNIDKRILTMKALIMSYEQTFKLVSLNKKEVKALQARLSKDYFWKLGYSLCAQSNRYKEALKYMKIGLSYNFYELRYYKTISITFIKSVVYR